MGSAPRTREAGTPYRAITEDGVDLALTRFPAQRAGQAPVLLTHGTFSNGGICARLAAYLAEHGFDAWVLDLRGHGGSQRAVPKPDFEAFGLLDVPAAIEAVRTHTGRRDVCPRGAQWRRTRVPDAPGPPACRAARTSSAS